MKFLKIYQICNYSQLYLFIFFFYLTEVTFKLCLILAAYLKISVNSMHLVK